MSKAQDRQMGRILAGGKPLTDEEIGEIDDADAALQTQLKRFFEAGPVYQPWSVPETAPRRGYDADKLVIPAGFRIEMACIDCDETTRMFVLDSKDDRNRYED